MLSVDPLLQEIGWRGEAERGMQPLAVVERLDVIEDVRPDQVRLLKCLQPKYTPTARTTARMASGAF